jgi:hypothetical protein
LTALPPIRRMGRSCARKRRHTHSRDCSPQSRNSPLVVAP